MYVPKHFKEENTDTLQRYIREYGFGVLVLADGEGIEANHVPFHLSVTDDNPLGVLQCHLARGNPVWRRIEAGGTLLAIFQGPDAYVSPSWYPSKAEDGRAVPTWNYLAVHVQGTARIVQDAVWLKNHLHQLTDQHEAGSAAPWSVDDAPADYTDGLIRALVGVEITIQTLTGKLKASQNQPERNRAGVKAGLENGGGLGDRAMAKLIG